MMSSLLSSREERIKRCIAKKNDKTYGLWVEPRPGVDHALEITAQQARTKTQTLRRESEALLLIFAEYVPLGSYGDQHQLHL